MDRVIQILAFIAGLGMAVFYMFCALKPDSVAARVQGRYAKKVGQVVPAFVSGSVSDHANCRVVAACGYRNIGEANAYQKLANCPRNALERGVPVAAYGRESG
jgi:hypothetical protein